MDCPLLWGIDVPIKGLMMTAVNALPVTFPTNEHQYRKSYEVTSKTRDRHRRPKRRQNDNRSHVITGTLWRFVFWTGCGMLDTFYCHWSDTSADSCDKLYTNTSTKLTPVLAPAPLLGCHVWHGGTDGSASTDQSTPLLTLPNATRRPSLTDRPTIITLSTVQHKVRSNMTNIVSKITKILSRRWRSHCELKLSQKLIHVSITVRIGVCIYT